MESLLSLDQTVFKWVNQVATADWLDTILPIWRTKTTWIPLYLLLLFMIARKHRKNTFWFLLVIGITILLSDQISSELIKKTVGRLRPCREPSLQNTVRTLIHCGGGYSFPSSHAANHFAVAMQLFLLFRLEWSRYYFVLLFLWASLIAYSQVYVGVHYPSDVLAGALLGVLVAAFVYFIAIAIKNKWQPNRS